MRQKVFQPLFAFILKPYEIFLFIFNIFIVLVYFYIFRQFSIYFLSFLKEIGKGKGRAATGESVTSHACIRQKPWRAFVG